MNSPARSGTIDHLAFGGSGVMRAEGMVIFVPFAAEQDHLTVNIVKQKKNYAEGQIASIDQASPGRISPRCPHFFSCRGCQFQHLKYEEQLKAKQRFVEDALHRQAALKVSVEPIIPSPQVWNYRKHIRLNLKILRNGFEAGYIGFDSSFLSVSQCYLFHKEQDLLFEQIKETLLRLSNQGIKEGSLKICKNNNQYLFAFSFFPYLPKNSSEIFSSFPFPVILQSPRQRESFGVSEQYFSLLGLDFFYSPYSFLQNNLEQSENLYKAILSQTTANTVLDFYCGIGITTLLLAQRGVSVIGVEANAEAIRLAKRNQQHNQIMKAQFLCSSVENVSVPYAPCILVNPPRTGLSPLVLNKILEMKPQEILYVSCMPSTLARDLKKIVAAGYAIRYAQPFDMFPQTTHVETFVKLTLEFF